MRVFSWERTQPSKLSEPVRIRLLAPIEVWCNGNTTDFDSVILGSSPSSSAIGPYVNWRDYLSSKQEVVGSNPAGPAIFKGGKNETCKFS